MWCCLVGKWDSRYLVTNRLIRVEFQASRGIEAEVSVSPLSKRIVGLWVVCTYIYGITPPSPTCMVKHYTYNLSSFWRRANSRNPPWLSLYGGNLTLALVNLFDTEFKKWRQFGIKTLKTFLCSLRGTFLDAKSLAKLPMRPAAPSSSLPESTKSFLLKTDGGML